MDKRGLSWIGAGGRRKGWGREGENQKQTFSDETVKLYISQSASLNPYEGVQVPYLL